MAANSHHSESVIANRTIATANRARPPSNVTRARVLRKLHRVRRGVTSRTLRSLRTVRFCRVPIVPMIRCLALRQVGSRIMTEDKAVAPTEHVLTRLAAHGEALVLCAIWIGLTMALVGLIDGISIAAKRVVADCPAGKFFPNGTSNFDCYSHPGAGLGIAIAAFSVMLGILIVLSSLVATTSLRGRSTTSVTQPFT